MKLVFGDFWEYPAEHRIITTNAVVRKDGACVMGGGGVADQARRRFPQLPYVLGAQIKRSGNHVWDLGIYRDLFSGFRAWSFPVKRHWKDDADLDLIEQSAHELVARMEHMDHPEGTWVLPRPGVGNGKLDWALVEPRIAFLPDSVHVITLA